MNKSNQPQMDEWNQPSDEWKELTLLWMKDIPPVMNEINQPSNEWKEPTL